MSRVCIGRWRRDVDGVEERRAPSMSRGRRSAARPSRAEGAPRRSCRGSAASFHDFVWVCVPRLPHPVLSRAIGCTVLAYRTHTSFQRPQGLR